MKTIQKFMKKDEDDEIDQAMAQIDTMRSKIKEQESEFVKQVQQESQNVTSVDDIIRRYKFVDTNAQVEQEIKLPEVIHSPK